MVVLRQIDLLKWKLRQLAFVVDYTVKHANCSSLLIQRLDDTQLRSKIQAVTLVEIVQDMNPEENPPEAPVSEQRSDNSAPGPSSPENQPVEANLVQAHAAEAVPVQAAVADSGNVPEASEVAKADAIGKPAAKMTPSENNLENMAASGGAVGALVLGIGCVLGSLITSYSIVNGMIGLLMGGWGLMSRKRKTTWLGIGLCVLGIGMCLVQVGNVVNTYINAVDETVR